ncbi:MAG: hypothetical protein DI535_16335 [Citrobacter freundii]|nr:MAG: hypothetical protein DI535_16335 [Citrobacter freundii]
MRLLLTGFILLSFISVRAADIRFFSGSWEQLLAEAKQQRKPIFVDIYTTWCTPCKQMDKYIFTEPSVSEKYNADFICYKLDAEKGEGIRIAKQYNITAYPTYLYLDPQGYPLHRAEGFFEAPAFLAVAQRAISLSGDDNALSFFEKEFNEGNREPAFLRKYIYKMNSLKLDNTSPLNAYFKVTAAAQLVSVKELTYLAENITSIHFRGLPFLLQHFGKLEKKEQQRLADRIYNSVLHNATGLAWKEGRVAEMQQLLTYGIQLSPLLSARLRPGLDRNRLLYQAMVKDLPGLKSLSAAIAKPLLSISLDSIQREDTRRFKQIMQPFFTGAQDSTRIPGFAEERKFAEHAYSGEINAKLYELSMGLADNLDPRDPALKQALQWINRADQILPGKPAITKLKERLENMLDAPAESPKRE